MLIERTRATAVEPWAAGERNLWMRLIPHEITGRRIGPHVPLIDKQTVEAGGDEVRHMDLADIQEATKDQLNKTGAWARNSFYAGVVASLVGGCFLGIAIYLTARQRPYSTGGHRPGWRRGLRGSCGTELLVERKGEGPNGRRQRSAPPGEYVRPDDQPADSRDREHDDQ